MRCKLPSPETYHGDWASNVRVQRWKYHSLGSSKSLPSLPPTLKDSQRWVSAAPYTSRILSWESLSLEGVTEELAHWVVYDSLLVNEGSHKGPLKGIPYWLLHWVCSYTHRQSPLAHLQEKVVWNGSRNVSVWCLPALTSALQEHTLCAKCQFSFVSGMCVVLDCKTGRKLDDFYASLRTL